MLRSDTAFETHNDSNSITGEAILVSSKRLAEKTYFESMRINNIEICFGFE